ncbi:hypothetical protein Q6D62_07660 [Corynebacterium diphtheriae]|uniref:hypothetical protein n=1 Tax=Corynebacterium diphtheriae TaxID=1717 RepID=UPI000AC25E1C|nr:hypothetical protein [Corynebacterium diphtheriae]UEB39469.1 hypothetical protein LK425_02480 [Corynebacterium diphtheriae]WLF42042.1 hypothetical protein Q6D62_07660 [Corynebacterium diphtheriae]
MAHTHVTIYQVVDDASRFDVGSQAFGTPETAPMPVSRSVELLMLMDFPKKSSLTTVIPLPPTIAAGCRTPNVGSPA